MTPRRPRTTTRAPQRLRVPALDTMDLSLHQHRSLTGARRRLRNVEQKLNEARTMLADAPPEVDSSIRNDLWQVIQLVNRMNQKLLLKRGRKPLSRPRPLPAEEPQGAPEDGTTIVAV